MRNLTLPEATGRLVVISTAVRSGRDVHLFYIKITKSDLPTGSPPLKPHPDVSWSAWHCPTSAGRTRGRREVTVTQGHGSRAGFPPRFLADPRPLPQRVLGFCFVWGFLFEPIRMGAPSHLRQFVISGFPSGKESSNNSLENTPGHLLKDSNQTPRQPESLGRGLGHAPKPPVGLVSFVRSHPCGHHPC